MEKITNAEMRKYLGDLNLEEANFVDMDDKNCIWGFTENVKFILGKIFSGDIRRKRYALPEKNGRMIIVTIAGGKISTARLYFIKKELISEMRSEGRKIKLANHETRENTIIFSMKVRSNILLHKPWKQKDIS